MKKILAIVAGMMIAVTGLAGTVIETDAFIYTNQVTFSNKCPAIQVDAATDTDGVNRRSMTGYVATASGPSFVSCFAAGNWRETSTTNIIVTNWTTRIISGPYTATISNVTINATGYYLVSACQTTYFNEVQVNTMELYIYTNNAYSSLQARETCSTPSARINLSCAGIIYLPSNTVVDVRIHLDNLISPFDFTTYFYGQSFFITKQ